TFEKIVGSMHIELPVRGLMFARVEPVQPLQMGDQVRTERRINMGPAGDPVDHFFLHQGSVKVAGIERHQADFTHASSFLTTSPYTSVSRKSRPWKRKV